MNKQKLLYLLIGIVTIIIILFGSAMFKLISENSQCVNNPFVYGAIAIENQGMPVVCRCDSLDPQYVGFSYDKNGIRIKDDFITDTFYNVSVLDYFNGDEGGEGVPQ